MGGKVYRAIQGGASTKGVDDLDVGAARYAIRVIPMEVLQAEDPWKHSWLTAPSDSAEPADEAQAAKAEKAKEKIRTRCTDFKDFADNLVDGVVIVAGDDDLDLANDALDAGLRFLRPGGRVVVYGPHFQPIVARQGAMRASANFVDVRLMQLFTREYQVLPQRTHPHMAADAQLLEGFILTVSKVGTSAGKAGDTGNDEKRQRVA